MTLKQQIGFWIGTLAAFIAILWVFSPILLPFVAGMALAYLLDPLADRLENLGTGRMWATVIILFLFLIVFLLLLILVLPVLGHQLAGFIERLPVYVTTLQGHLARLGEGRFENLLGISSTDLKDNLSELVGQGAVWLVGLMKSIWSGGQALLSVISLFVVTPVVAFYLLYDWDHMIEKIDSWLPRDHVPTVRRLAREMNAGVAGFVRGQVSVSLILGTFYAVGLMLIGLNFGLLIGIGAGLVSFIPYVGATLGFIVSLGVALVQFWPDWPMIAAVFAVFVAGQFLEGNVLQPKLVGNNVGLHPVWLMFALFAFGYLFGFVGMLVAVPAAAAVGVLTRFGLSQYLASSLYHGKASMIASEAAKPSAAAPEEDTGGVS